MRANDRQLLSLSPSAARRSFPAETKAMLGLIPGYVKYLDRDLTILYANDAYQRMRGLSDACLIGRHCRDALGEDGFSVFAPRIEEALAGKVVEIEFFVDRDGRRQWLVGEIRPDRDESGAVIGLLSISIDLELAERLRHKIEATEFLFDEAFDNIPIGVAIVATDGRYRRVNAAYAKMLGHDPQAFSGRTLEDFTLPGHVSMDHLMLQTLGRDDFNGSTYDKRYLHADGSAVEGIVSVTVMRNRAGEVVQHVSHVIDMTDMRRAERELQARNAQLSMAVKLITGGFWRLDLATQMLEPSPELRQFIGWAEDQPVTLQDYIARIRPEDLEHASLNDIAIGESDHGTAQYRLQTAHGERWIRCNRQLLRDAAGQPTMIVGMAIDFTEEREEVLSSQAAANTDLLTGLLNRRGLKAREPNILARPRWAVMAVDLDGFKQVNDRLGHAAGDEVLIEAAAAMRMATREGDIIARMGGDEFAIVLPDADRHAVETIATRLVVALTRQQSLPGSELVAISGSIGCALVEPPGLPLDKALARADQALYAAKRAGKHTWRIY